MCLPLLGAAGAAAGGLGGGLSAISTVVGMVSSVAGIAQAQQGMQMQAAQYQQQMNLQYQQAQQQAYRENQANVTRHQNEVRAQQAGQLSYYQQLANNNEAANKVYTQEQVKLNEARTAAAFKAQENYIKAIGSKGKVLASGATGQSIGLLALDADRQAGFADAQQNASLRSAEDAATVGMDIGFTQAKSAHNQAYSKLTPPVQAPLMAPDPQGIGTNLELGIPAYDWS